MVGLPFTLFPFRRFTDGSKDERQLRAEGVYDSLFPFRRFTDGSKGEKALPRMPTGHSCFHSDASQMEAKVWEQSLGTNPDMVSIQTLHRWKQSFKTFLSNAQSLAVSIQTLHRWKQSPVSDETQKKAIEGFHSDASQMEAKH